MGYGLAFDGYLISKPLNQAVILLIKTWFCECRGFFFHRTDSNAIYESPKRGEADTQLVDKHVCVV